MSPNTTFVFSMWALNLIDPDVAALADPRLGFSVDGVEYGDTGSITETADPAWTPRSFVFNSGARTSVTVALTGKTADTNGNDLLLDDLALAPCAVPSGTIPRRCHAMTSGRSSTTVTVRAFGASRAAFAV